MLELRELPGAAPRNPSLLGLLEGLPAGVFALLDAGFMPLGGLLLLGVLRFASFAGSACGALAPLEGEAGPLGMLPTVGMAGPLGALLTLGILPPGALLAVGLPLGALPLPDAGTLGSFAGSAAGAPAPLEPDPGPLGALLPPGVVPPLGVVLAVGLPLGALPLPDAGTLASFAGSAAGVPAPLDPEPGPLGVLLPPGVVPPPGVRFASVGVSGFGLSLLLVVGGGSTTPNVC